MLNHTTKRPGQHVGARTCGRLVVLTGYAGLSGLERGAHDLLHDAPDEERDEQDEVQRLDVLGAFEEQSIDDLIVLGDVTS